jgi:mRNA interferase HigB
MKAIIEVNRKGSVFKAAREQIAGAKRGRAPDYRLSFESVSQANVSTFPALRQLFGSADYVDGFTIFDVGGNRYRIAVVIHYDKHRLYVRHVMTHAEYDRNMWRKR